MTEDALRAAIVAACRDMNASGLNQGTSGNISARLDGGRMLITPSGVPYDRLTPDMLVTLPLDGPPDLSRRPSSEWPFHRALLAARPDTGAVVHAHPAYCTALAVARAPIPACHYMVAVFGGGDVRMADYALFGSDALAAGVVAACDGRHGCLMANHGAVVLGETLERAMWRLGELEALARAYVLARTLGEVTLLSQTQMAEAVAAIGTYGPGRRDIAVTQT